MTHEVRIRATPEQVWSVLVDFAAYPEWNPFFVEVAGQLAVGEKLEIRMVPVGKKAQSFAPRVLEVEPDEELVWRGRVGVPWLFDGRHSFTIERVDQDTVVFRQHERFAGLFVPFVGLGPYRAGWERMDRALVERVERGEGDHPRAANH